VILYGHAIILKSSLYAVMAYAVTPRGTLEWHCCRSTSSLV